jgi:hypothetical protein
MTTIAIFPDSSGAPDTQYRAIAGPVQAVGRTAGEALDALSSQLSAEESGTLVVVQHRRPDAFFTAEQQQRLQELMARWRTARDAGRLFSPDEQAELDELIEAELRAAAARAVATHHDLGYFAMPSQQQTDSPAVPIDRGQVAEEAEPIIEPRWSAARRKIRAAAKAYSEQTHADY